MAARRVKPGWKILAAVVVVGGLWASGPALLRRLSFFRLRRVEFVGLRYLTPATLMPAVKLSPSASLFDPVDSVESRLRKLPGVRDVSVSRRLAGTLRIEITEAEPVALVPGSRGMLLVDERGRVLPYDPTVSAPDLPLAPQADSLIAAALARVRDLDPALFARISSAQQIRGDVVLDVDSRRWWLRPNPSAEAILAVTAVAEDLARRGWTYTELDGRFAGQVVVRGKRA